MDQCDLIDELGEIIYISDVETHELLFANRHMKNICGHQDIIGKKCYSIIQGLDAPCPFCTNAKLNYHHFYIWEFTNPNLNRHFLLKDKLIDWKGHPARIEVALDITEQENLSQQVQQKLKTEQTIVDCIRMLIAADSLETAIQAVLSGICNFYQADRSYILELNQKEMTGTNTYEYCAPGVPSQIGDCQNISLDNIPLWKNSISNRALISIQNIEDIQKIYPSEYKRMKKQGIYKLVAAPFSIEEKGLGYIGVDNPKYNSEDPSLLQALSYFIILELQKRRMQAKLEYQNSHDALTGLYNRFQYLKYIESRRTEELSSIGVVFCDINGLKKINDIQGHSARDNAIIHTADVLLSSFPVGQVYRLSGDEFIVICENIGKEDFHRMVQRAHERLNNRVSIGSIYENTIIDLTALVRKADEQMYQEKQSYYQQNPRL